MLERFLTPSKKHDTIGSQTPVTDYKHDSILALQVPTKPLGLVYVRSPATAMQETRSKDKPFTTKDAWIPIVNHKPSQNHSRPRSMSSPVSHPVSYCTSACILYVSEENTPLCFFLGVALEHSTRTTIALCDHHWNSLETQPIIPAAFYIKNASFFRFRTQQSFSYIKGCR